MRGSLMANMDGTTDTSTRGANPSTQQGPLALIVDDDEQLLRINARALIQGGYRVETAQDAEAGLAALRRTAFDVLVSYIAMPEMSGIDLVERLRADGTDLPVVLMTRDPQ